MTIELPLADRIREADHRIKNHLQMVAGLLALQSRRSASSELREELDDAAHRIMAVALLHQQLQRAGDRPVDMAAYLQEICRGLAISSDCEGRGVRLSLRVESGDLPGEQAMTLGLITSELVTNALKYAYGARSGAVVVKLEDQAGDWRLTVADQGPGLATSQIEAGGFGLGLVGRLAQKLGGDFTVVSDGLGAEFRVDFPSSHDGASRRVVGSAIPSQTAHDPLEGRGGRP
jgi:two-component sensor histidine kinase